MYLPRSTLGMPAAVESAPGAPPPLGPQLTSRAVSEAEAIKLKNDRFIKACFFMCVMIIDVKHGDGILLGHSSRNPL
jgi:hypothetical protein